MRIIVTGGCGFIGSFVVDHYVREGHTVSIVDNLSSGRMENKNEKAKLYVKDIRDPDLEEVFREERPQVVNHHAAQISVPLSVEDPLTDLEVNAGGTLRLLELSLKYGVKRFVFASTGGAIYGEVDGPADESVSPRPLSPYAISKLAAERYIEFFHHHYGLAYTILRYSNVYGPRQIPHGEAGVVAIFLESLIKGERPTLYHFEEEPRGMVRDYVFVEDVARANLLALKEEGSSVLNIGTGKGTHTLELYGVILEALRSRGLAIEGQLDEPNRAKARPGDIRKSILSVEKAKRAGWKPLFDLKAGIERTVNFYLSEDKVSRHRHLSPLT